MKEVKEEDLARDHAINTFKLFVECEKRFNNCDHSCENCIFCIPKYSDIITAMEFAIDNL